MPATMSFDVHAEAECDLILQRGLAEDLGTAGDITSSACIPANARGRARLVARQTGVVAGLPMLARLAGLYGQGLEISLVAVDGAVQQGEVLAQWEGPVRTLLACERLALNFLARLSGVATLTARYGQAVSETRARICDTRKTTPGWRHLEKYAVRVGGGVNHRIGLFDAVLIKDNHLAALAALEPQPVTAAVRRCRQAAAAQTTIELEVDSLAQLEIALGGQAAEIPDIVLLDNMGPEQLAAAVRRRDERAPTVLLEASGGITLANVAAIAATGVDRISIGALTHSAPALDLALDYLAENA